MALNRQWVYASAVLLTGALLAGCGSPAPVQAAMPAAEKKTLKQAMDLHGKGGALQGFKNLSNAGPQPGQ